MRVGTSHFVNFTKACDYYRDQGNDELSPAELERLALIDNGTRYAVED